VPSVDTVVTWIPGEVVAAYSAIVLALQPETAPGGDPAPLAVTWGGWIVGGFIFACVLAFLGGWLKRTNAFDSKAKKELWVRTLLAGIAFLIWSFVVPGSWWFSFEQIAEYPGAVGIVAGLVGVVFSLVAEAWVRKYN